jgi:hypothetical protein
MIVLRDPAYAAAILLDGLSDLPPSERTAAEGRLIQELERVLAENRARAAEIFGVLAAVRTAIDARGARPRVR